MKITKIDAWTLLIGTSEYTFVADGAEWNGMRKLRCVDHPGYLIVMDDPDSGMAPAFARLFGAPSYANIVAGSPDLLHAIKSMTGAP